MWHLRRAASQTEARSNILTNTISCSEYWKACLGHKRNWWQIWYRLFRKWGLRLLQVNPCTAPGAKVRQFARKCGQTLPREAHAAIFCLHPQIEEPAAGVAPNAEPKARCCGSCWCYRGRGPEECQVCLADAWYTWRRNTICHLCLLAISKDIRDGSQSDQEAPKADVSCSLKAVSFPKREDLGCKAHEAKATLLSAIRKKDSNWRHLLGPDEHKWGLDWARSRRLGRRRLLSHEHIRQEPASTKLQPHPLLHREWSLLRWSGHFAKESEKQRGQNVL